MNTNTLARILQLPLILVALVCYSTVTYAGEWSETTGPTGTLQGVITGENNEVLPYAHIALPDLNRGTITRRDGSFSIADIPVGSHRLIASHVGYERQEQQVQIEQNTTASVTFGLTLSQEMPQIEILGKAPERLARVPGSANVITTQQLERTQPLSSSEALRQIPGINAVQAEPMGLRASIGIRGLDPDMSRNVLILEDGIPVALAPYGEPEMYYTPAITRMSGVEVIKGSGSILFGPRTIGGVINFITPDPPVEEEFGGYVSGGQNGYFTGRFTYGNRYGASGLHVTYLRRQASDMGPLSFHLDDLNAKWQLSLSDRSAIGFKLGVYNEASNATYVGLSQPMFDSGQYDFARLAPDDELLVRRYAASATHDLFLGGPGQTRLRTTGYAYTTRRNWSRQDFDNTPVPGREYSRYAGNTNTDFGAIYFRPSTGNRNREFEVAGIESRLSTNFFTGDLRHELDTGVRFLFERAYEQRINGSIVSPASGDLRDDEIRTGYAASAYVQNRTYVTPNLTVTPGVRLESFRYEREMLRSNFQDVSILGHDRVLALIPGLGVAYEIGPFSSLFAGVHRGFSPPRVKDALTSDGSSYELDAESSWSYEAGMRLRVASGLNLETTLYYMDFSNQVIPVSESSGGQGVPNATGLVNGGATTHYGLEYLVRWNSTPARDGSLLLEIETGGAWAQAWFSEDRFVAADGGSVNIKDNRLPYAPELSVHAQVSASHTSGFSGYLRANHIGEQFGDVLNRREPGGNGRTGMVDAYTLFDAGVDYKLPIDWDARVFVHVKNLTDERYISSRRPQGIRVGLPRMVSFGVQAGF